MKIMEITDVQYIHGSPYRTIARLAKEEGISIGTVRNIVNEIRAEIKKGRYDEFAVSDGGGIIRINYLVFNDYWKYRKHLKDKNLRKNVPPYNPAEQARVIGWYAD